MGADDVSIGPGSFLRQALIVIGIATLAFVALWILGQAVNVLLLVFSGVLLAVLLRGLTDVLKRVAPLPDKAALATVILTLLLLSAVGIWLTGPSVAAQIDQLTEDLPKAIQQVTGWIQQYEWSQALISQAPSVGQLAGSGGNMLSQMTGIFSSTLNTFGNFVLLLFLGLFFAAEPGLYMDGFIRLMPRDKRARTREVLRALEHTLRWWLTARILSMTIIGVATTIGLWVLGVPLAFILGLLTGLLTFVPIIGATLAALPPLLLAYTVSPTTALYVLILYLVIQLLESNLITPLIQEKAVNLAPVLTLTTQVLMGILFGVVAIALATPLTAVITVLVKMLYVEDILGDPVGIKKTGS